MKMIRILGNNNWGFDTKSLTTIYRALILSAIDIIYNSAEKKFKYSNTHSQSRYTFGYRCLQIKSCR